MAKPINYKAEYRKLRKVAEFARSAIDEHLGDSDLDGDDSPLFLACQKLSKVLNK